MVETPVVPVSWGELIDKITILEIKRQRLRSPDAAADVEREIAALAPIMAKLEPLAPELAALHSSLSAVNARLWDIEDAIREKEAQREFDASFIALARSVYRENDARGRLKRDINQLLGSAIIERKQYSEY